MVGKIDRRHLTRVGVGQDLHHVAVGHGDEVVHRENRKERLVEPFRRHRSRGQHRDLRAHPRVHDEVLARRRRDCLGDLRDIRVFEIRGNALLRLAQLCGLTRLAHSRGSRLRGRKRGGAKERQGAACEKNKTFH